MAKRGAWAMAIAAAILLAGGCTTHANQASSSSPTPAASTACDAASRHIVESFIESFNLGDEHRLDSLVAEPGAFVWYASDAPGERINDDAKDRSTLLAYFANRHNHQERLVLRSFRVNGTSGTSLSNFEFTLLRSSSDGLASTPYVGKGAIACDRGPYTLAVWSMARDPAKTA